MPDALPLVPETLLDAVNALLNSVGLSPIDSLLDTDANTDSQKAFQAVARTNSQVQSQGWNCNTENFALTPDVNGQVQAAPNWLRVRPQRNKSLWAAGIRVTLRGTKLYDLKAHSFTFSTFKTVDLEVVQALAFEDLPQALRWYITCRAGKEFGVGTYPSSGTFRFTEAEELKAKAEAEQEDGMLREQTLPETSEYFAKMRRR